MSCNNIKSVSVLLTKIFFVHTHFTSKYKNVLVCYDIFTLGLLSVYSVVARNSLMGTPFMFISVVVRQVTAATSPLVSLYGIMLLLMMSNDARVEIN